jgi:peptide/nickel transport system substrate-binding protein
MFGKRLSRRSFVKAGAGAAGLAGVTAVAPVTGFTAAEALAQEDDRGTLIMRGSGSTLPAHFNPLLIDVRVWLYDGLIRFDENMNPIPDLAESWEISADGLVYTIKLRQNVTFHDGQPMTADDVVYTAQLTLDETINSPYRSKFIIGGQPVTWEKVDDYTVRATLPQPSSSFLAKLSRADEIFFCILPKHLLEECTDMNTCDFNLNPVGTGPFKFVEYKADERLVLASHDDYFEGKPGVKQLARLAYPNEQSALAALKSGELDVTTLREAGNVKAAEEDPNLTVHRYYSNWIMAARFNFANPALQDLAVRQAFSYAIDRANLVKAAVAPTATVGDSPISIGWAANPNVTKYEFDAEKAKSLLDQAGWSPGGGGIREKDGTKLSFSLTINPDYAAPDLAVGMQAFLSQVGIELNIEQVETAVFNDTVYKNKDFDIYLDWQGFGVDPDIASRWSTSTADAGTYLSNPSGYSNPEVDEAFKAAEVAPTQEERQTHLWKAQELITADAPAVWLYLWEALVTVSKNVGGLGLPGSTADMDNTGVFREPWKLTSLRK